MTKYEYLRWLIRNRQPLKETEFVNVQLVNGDHVFRGMFMIEWWGQYHCFLAAPVAFVDGRPYKAKVRIDDSWVRLIKRYFKDEFNIRHLQYLTSIDNEQRVQSLLNVQYISD